MSVYTDQALYHLMDSGAASSGKKATVTNFTSALANILQAGVNFVSHNK